MHKYIQSLINELKTAPKAEILKFAAEEPETAALIAEVIKVDIKRKTDIIAHYLVFNIANRQIFYLINVLNCLL